MKSTGGRSGSNYRWQEVPLTLKDSGLSPEFVRWAGTNRALVSYIYFLGIRIQDPANRTIFSCDVLRTWSRSLRGDQVGAFQYGLRQSDILNSVADLEHKDVGQVPPVWCDWYRGNWDRTGWLATDVAANLRIRSRDGRQWELEAQNHSGVMSWMPYPQRREPTPFALLGLEEAEGSLRDDVTSEVISRAYATKRRLAKEPRLIQQLEEAYRHLTGGDLEAMKREGRSAQIRWRKMEELRLKAESEIDRQKTRLDTLHEFYADLRRQIEEVEQKLALELADAKRRQEAASRAAPQAPTRAPAPPSVDHRPARVAGSYGRTFRAIVLGSAAICGFWLLWRWITSK